ncbi:hypothetical protein Rhsp01_25320 [Rhizobium sp. NBRC 114257]|uniref:Uncharacterized protein n=1 Tax=Rhizobium dioscoreae TaxID=2653122 RepID=A0ABQ0ZBN6_9HYPH|nr:hypothetical protein RsS93_53160 [Rhizobium dioscoreae]GLU81356.1 hypothetical protein Rhsp01_25320 [Rhizobium sp. NBRC 114257]
MGLFNPSGRGPEALKLRRFTGEPAEASFAGRDTMASNKKAPTLILSKGEGWGRE